MQNDFTKNNSEKKVEETQKTENTEDMQNKPVDTLIADTNENKEETKDIKKSVTFGNEEVKIIGQDQEKCDDDNNSSSEPNISLESNEFTDDSSHLSPKSPFEVDTEEKEEEDDDYEIPCLQMRRCPRAFPKMFADDDNGSDTDNRDINQRYTFTFYTFFTLVLKQIPIFTTINYLLCY